MGKSLFDLVAGLINGTLEKSPEEKKIAPKKEKTDLQKRETTPERKETASKKTGTDPKKGKTAPKEKTAASKKAETAPEEKKVAPYRDGITTEDELLKNIVRVFHSVYKGRKSKVEENRFTLWVADNAKYEIAKGQDFTDGLVTKLADEGYGQTVWNSVRLEMPAPDHTFTAVADRIFLQIETKETPRPAVQRAKVTAIPGKGSLVKEECLLDSQERKRYNIGVGVIPDMQGKGFRENQIAIDDNADSPQYANNRYASRAHAFIGFSDKYGFYLQVEPGGSRVYAGRTQIFREDKAPLEVENTELPVPLLSGDIIMLGKAVALRFENIDNQ